MLLEDLGYCVNNFSSDGHLVRIEISGTFGWFDLKLKFGLLLLNFLLLSILLISILHECKVVFILKKQLNFLSCEGSACNFGFILIGLLCFAFFLYFVRLLGKIKIVFIVK
jgi:hypothetical protein